MDGVPPGGVSVEGDRSGGLAGARRRSSDATAVADTVLDGLEGLPVGLRGGAAFAKAEQVLGQRMERVATAWLEAIDQVRLFPFPFLVSVNVDLFMLIVYVTVFVFLFPDPI